VRPWVDDALFGLYGQCGRPDDGPACRSVPTWYIVGMRIAIIGQKGLPLGEDAGGVERHVEELGARLASRGNEVLVYVRPRYATAPEREYRGMKLVRTWSLQMRSFDTVTHCIASTLDAARRGAEVIHYHGVGPATVAWLARLLAPRAKVVVTFHSIDRLHQKWGPLARLYLRHHCGVARHSGILPALISSRNCANTEWFEYSGISR
jgi:hypothetical protein